MNKECVFCLGFETNDPTIFWQDQSGLFAGKWDHNPVRPGHALLMPKRHVQHFEQLTDAELEVIAFAAKALKQVVRQADLIQVYRDLAPINDVSAAFIQEATDLLKEMDGRQPDAFNDAINDGSAAGQTVPHMHWHIIPRWNNDAPEARGGIRRMFGSNDKF